MRIIDNRKGKNIIVLILKQMQLIEKNLKANNLSATEILVDNNLKDQVDIDPIKSFVYEKNDLINLSEDKKIYIEENHYTNYYNDVAKVIWNLDNNKEIIFFNNADIIISKYSKKKINYEIKYNLINDYLKINLKSKKSNNYLEINNGLLIRRYNDIEIVENLHSKDNIKKVKIDSRRNNNETHKINKSYKINLLNNEVILAQKITRKGKKIDMLENNNLQEESIKLLEFYTNNISYEEMQSPIDYLNIVGNEVLKNICDMKKDLELIPGLESKIDDYINQIRSHENMNVKKLVK